MHHAVIHLRTKRKTYNCIQLVIRLCDVDLPSWKTVQYAKSHLQKITHCKDIMSELGNPIVSKYLEFYPEDTNGENLYKYSQSAKWLHQYPRELRVQMIKVGVKSYYLYGPTQIIDGNVVVPIFFYIIGGIMYEKVCKLNVCVLSSSELQISISGDLSFYASDLKEILVQDFLKTYMEITANYGRLLAEKCRNFLLATSNIESALELCAPVVKELNTLSSTGFWAFDSSLNEDVLVIPVVLLFMGDSPMYAEISSTMQPNISLQPCRICCLKAESKKEKATTNYVDRFIGHNSNCVKVCDKLHFIRSK
ncbi:hypothetical protein PPACK8108_LOCUS2433 [Phakopsora pachyrhizi]|uniref:Uncharacterized protein n=1 Tax=Phakopsora pachyrhizi TaxID=170000 RepID=A0AAV0AHW6_PHAPC|nr:hypothetical protein PPACK8108_LOCUS2433 [Phakopsora pachyrhizi]